jgi:prophage regulatory protein
MLESTHLTRVELVDAKPVVRRQQLRTLVPLADTTIYEMEQRGEFPKRFYLTPRCPVWDLGEVNAWLAGRRRATENGTISPLHPDVRRRKVRPVRL